MLTRRRFLELAGLGLAGGAAGTLWLTPRRARAATPVEPLLVVIFLRGGADGLHLVPPIGDPGYAKARGALALGKTLPFAEGFGLHPALEPLEALVRRGELAAVHAVGSGDRSRSHFEAQDLMELADPTREGVGSGWLARALSGDVGGSDFARIALANAPPLSLEGAGAFAIGDPARFGLPHVEAALRRAVEARYAEAGDPFARAGRRAFAALAEYERRTAGSAVQGTGTNERGSRRGRRRPDPPLPERVAQLLALERAGLPIRAVTFDAHGWDTHQRQGAEEGALVRPLRELGVALAALADGLRGRRDWLAVAMTEFGRTVHPNGSQGTDHGHASAMLVAGPRVRPGVHGPWPGLAAGALHEGRDLAVTTDYRDVLAEVLTAHLGAPPPARTFPGFVPTPLGVVA